MENLDDQNGTKANTEQWASVGDPIKASPEQMEDGVVTGQAAKDATEVYYATGKGPEIEVDSKRKES